MTKEKSVPEKYEVGSERWIDTLRELLEDGLAGADLTGVQVAFYEECLNPPAHLLAAGETSVAWTVRVDENGAQVDRGRIADPDFFLELDYTAALAIANVSVSDPELPRIMADFEEKGLLRRGGDGSKMPPQVGAAWLKLHDELGKRKIGRAHV